MTCAVKPKIELLRTTGVKHRRCERMTAMLKQFLPTAAFSALALGAALAAEPASLSGDELRKAVSGKTVYLRISGFELPIR